jgi:inosine-uridine nucleoside N-ribohydrolase
MKKVIFDTDPGIDDAMALLFLKRAPEVDIVGVTTSFGNGAIETTTRNALYLCELFGIEAPVARGAARPLAGEARAPAAHVHGDDALGGVASAFEPVKAPQTLSADAAIVDLVRRYPHQISIVAVAPLTNLALALRRDPAIAALVKEVIVMGGAFGFRGHSGNVGPVTEANIGGDPLAADEVLGAPWPVTLVGLDVTQETVMPAEMVDRLGRVGGAEGRFIRDIAGFYLDFHRAYEGLNGMFVHDSSAVACLLDPSIFVMRRGPVRVVRDGIAAGQTIQSPSTRKITPPAWQGRPDQSVCVGVDPKRVLDLYFETVTAGN